MERLIASSRSALHFLGTYLQKSDLTEALLHRALATAHCDFDIYYPTIEIDGVVIYERDRFNDEYLFANDVCEQKN